MHRPKVPLGLIALAFFLVGRTGVASACTCTEPSLREALAQAEFVFIGTVSDLGLDYVKHERVTDFAIQRVFKGTMPERLRVVSALDEAACGYKFSRGAVYLVFARTVSGRAATSLCGGNRALTAGQNAPPDLGPGTPPVAPAPRTTAQ